jgi:membrane protein involved in colicin uptake
MGAEDNKVIEALKEKIDAMQAEIDSMKAAKAKEEEEAAQKAAAEEKEAAEKAAAEEAKKAAEAEEAFKKALIERIEALEQRVSKASASSKSIQGQDGVQPPDISEKSRRDSFGRVRRG